MRTALPIVVAVFVAAAGLLCLQAAELLTRVAFENGRLPGPWHQVLADDWRALLAFPHPLNLVSHFLPAAAVAAWVRARAAAWILVACVFGLTAVDGAVLLDTSGGPNNDYKGCEACLAALVLRLFTAPIWLVLLMIGVAMLVNHSLEEAKK